MKQVTLTEAETGDGVKYNCTYTETQGSFGTVNVNNAFTASHAPGTADANHSFSIVNGTLKVDIPSNAGNGSEYALVNNVLTVNNGFTGSITAMYEFTALTMREIDFCYDHNGLRTQKKIVENGETTTYEYMLHGKLITHLKKRVNGTLTHVLHFFYDANSRPAMVKYGSMIYRYVHNLQGDIVGILDANGNLVVEYKYDAWGRPISTTGSLKTTLGELNPFRYRGYIYDGESGQYYLKCRYYDYIHQRFINADKFVGEMPVLITCNTFAYCKNDPNNKSDSDGMKSARVTSAMPIAHDFPIMPVVHDVPRNSSINKTRVSQHAIDQLIINASIAQKKAKELSNAYSNPVDRVAAVLIWFKDQVNHGKVWDYKNSNRTPAWLREHHVEKVTIEGMEMNMEEYGNLNYGFVGYAMGLPRMALISGSYYAHYTSHGNFDEDPHDLAMIDAGIAMAARYMEAELI